MEYGMIAIVCVVIVLLLYKIMGVSLKKIKTIAENENLNKQTDQFPTNIEIGRAILKQLGNVSTKIEENTEEKNTTSLYIVATDTISIANQKHSYTRIQTIAHECIHSMQDKVLLWCNFIATNLFLLAYVVVFILTMTKVISNGMLVIAILLIVSFVIYAIRSYLEQDAMLKARWVAKEYMEKAEIIEKDKINEIVSAYDQLNQIGIKVYLFQLMTGNIGRILLYTILCFVLSL